MKKVWALNALLILTLAAVALTPFVTTKELLYPFFMPKALFLRSVVLLALPFYVYLLMVDKSLRPSLKNPVSIFIVLFFLVNLIAGIFGANPMRSFWGNYERMGGNYNLLHLTLLYFYILLLAKQKEIYLEWFLKILVWMGFLTSAYGILEKLGMTPWVPDDSLPLRVSSIFGNPIFFASVLCITIFVTAFFALQAEGKWKYSYWSFVGIQIIALILTGTRGALVGLGLGAVVALAYYFLFSKKYKKQSGIALGVLVILGLGIFFVGPHLPKNSVLNRLSNFNDTNGQSRIIQWGMALKGFKAHPVLGVGPENYYVISNTYFDRKLYSFDYSWFDKPHNYWLEILTTSGIFGLLCYLGIILSAGLALFRAQKNNLISLSQAATLLAGLVAYQAQNMFVFDTPTASLALLVFLAMCGIVYGQDSEPQKEKKLKNSVFVLPTFYVLAALSLYGFIITDWVTAKVGQDINYGYAIDIQDPSQAKSYFDKAGQHSFIYDPGELAVKTEEFTVRAVQDSNKKDDKEFINSLFDDAINKFENVNKQVTNNPIYWFKLGNLYSQKAYYNKTGFNQRAEDAINKAIALVPQRIEPLFFLVQIQALKNNIPEVVRISEQINQMVPNNPEATWRLALAYKDGNQVDKAVQTAEKAQSMGYNFKLVREFRWLINYYADKEDFQKVRELYEQAIKLSPNDYQLYASLATVYAKLGMKDKAIEMAHKVLQLNPQSQQTVDAFLKALQN